MMKNEYPQRLISYAKAIAELLLYDEVQSAKLLDEKFQALKKTWAITEHYASNGFLEVILDAIMAKKSRLILDATSVRDIREIAAPPRPRFNGSEWFSLSIL